MSTDRYILKLKYYDDAIQYTYTKKNFNKKFSSHQKKSTTSVNTDESLRCSISRSISNIKELCLCNSFDFFFTLTVADKHRSDVKFASELINKAIKEYGKKAEGFKYLYVFEKQKKGGIHIHGFFSGFYDLTFNEYGHLESTFFKKIGFQCIEPLGSINPFYLIKYIAKEPIKELNHRYFRSRNLKKARTEYIHADFDEFSDFSFTFKNNMCKMVTIEN